MLPLIKKYRILKTFKMTMLSLMCSEPELGGHRKRPGSMSPPSETSEVLRSLIPDCPELTVPELHESESIGSRSSGPELEIIFHDF